MWHVTTDLTNMKSPKCAFCSRIATLFICIFFFSRALRSINSVRLNTMIRNGRGGARGSCP